VIPLVVAACVLSALASAVVVPRFLERQRYATGRDGCADVPMAPVVTPATHPDSLVWPYGAVHACRVLGGGARLFGGVEVSYTLELETDSGPVLVRLEYTNVEAGRHYSSQAVELDPTGADLEGDEVERIRAAIAGRGGLQPVPWILHYGDG